MESIAKRSLLRPSAFRQMASKWHESGNTTVNQKAFSQNLAYGRSSIATSCAFLHSCRQPRDLKFQEERWQQFKTELYKSKFWQQYKERSENPTAGFDKRTYKDNVEREIQRAWDESGKVKSLCIPDPEKFSEIRNARPEVEAGEVTKQTPESESLGEGKNGMAQNGRMQRYLVTVEYAGTRFLGWQKQKNRPDLRTVQGTLEDAFNKFIGQPVVCGGSSRTDTGVHALANVCHIDAERVSKRRPGEYLPPHEPEVVKRAVNHFLQKDAGLPICSRSRFRICCFCDLHLYHYRIIAGNPFPSIFERDRAWNIPETLDLHAMQEAAEELMGHHDFSSFRAAGCQAKSPVKTLDELHICEMPAWPCFPSLEERIPRASTDVTTGVMETEQKGERKLLCTGDFVESKSARPRCYVITARARSFLYHQVRLLVGTLKAVGCGILTRQDVRRILNARSIKETPAMAPAFGLYLAEVKYDFENPKTREHSTMQCESP
ncbi:hypothetical protein R1flu_002721 [Riccia fluitans]|uniref:tRNA pseudouridine synthase n=1 Tax=Riccia fluitans TaxID=41844 RepID=A0ABD1Y7A9_9MARC